MFARLGSWFYAAGVARKHCANWHRLLVDALLGRRGEFRSRARGEISCDAKMLLRQLVQLENAWQHWGDVLGAVMFENDSLVISSYFGREFRIPLRAGGVAPPSAFLKYYRFDVTGETVLDIGAYLGDTPLMWLHKGAKSVIAVEPVPLHFQYLKKNVEGLPVTCLNVSLAVQLPKIQNHEGSISYGLLDRVNGELLNVPVVQLIELVEKYKPTVVKLNCEGCEHYVLDQLSEIPKIGVRKIAVQFHGIRGFDPYVSLAFLEEKLGKANKTLEKRSIDLLGKVVRTVTVYWLL